MYKNFHKISNDEYHANKETIGHSSLVKMLKSPAHFAEYMMTSHVQTPAKAMGSAIHAVILEPEEFAKNYAVVDEELLTGTVQSFDDYKAAADKLGISYGVPTKDELKLALKAVEGFGLAFRDDVATEMAALTQNALIGALQSLDDYRAAATALGIDVKLKKEELKAAITAADVNFQYRFKEDVQAEMAALAQQRFVGTLQSLDDYKGAAASFGVRTEALTKDELKAAIRAADVNSEFRFKEDVYSGLYGDKIILKQEDVDALRAMHSNVLQHKAAKKFLSSGQAELSAFWTDPNTGIQCKCKPDWLNPDGIYDVKSCRDASAEGFAKAISTYGYDIEAAFYTDGVKAATGLTLPFYFIATENTAPFSAAVYRASDAMLETGRKKYRAALELLQWCREKGQYPSYQPFGDVETIDLPKWDQFDVDE
ncbi:MAG: PD-(D/E)XK nuclease-like domain-containing protein [Burkholderiales bacterium]